MPFSHQWSHEDYGHAFVTFALASKRSQGKSHKCMSIVLVRPLVRKWHARTPQRPHATPARPNARTPLRGWTYIHCQSKMLSRICEHTYPVQETMYPPDAWPQRWHGKPAPCPGDRDFNEYTAECLEVVLDWWKSRGLSQGQKRYQLTIQAASHIC